MVSFQSQCSMKMQSFVLLICLAFTGYTSASRCELSVRGQLTNVAPPLIFTVDNDMWKLASPSRRDEHNSYIDLTDKTVGFACPGRNNMLLVGRKIYGPQATGSCFMENGKINFIIENNKIQSDQIHCKSVISGYEEITNKSCNNDGLVLKLGFQVNNKMHDLITTCHRVRDGKTYYSAHTVSGGHFPTETFHGHAAKRRNFYTVNTKLYRGFSPNNAYKEENEKKCLSQSIGGRKASEVFNKVKDQFFGKGHLAPNGDFVMDTWRDITFLYVNTQPQWQMINGGNWDVVEDDTRDLASRKGIDLSVVTGTSGLLTPQIDIKKGKPLYLGPRKTHPVPEVFWKLVQDENNHCMGLISNNFVLEHNTTVKCQDICTQYGWLKKRHGLNQGYIYCCSYDEMKHAFPEVPNAKCSGILHH